MRYAWLLRLTVLMGVVVMLIGCAPYQATRQPLSATEQSALEALSPQDRQAVLAGFPREGMSTDALRLLWGEPYYTRGYADRYGYWYYLGSAFTLAEYGNRHTEAGTVVIVEIADGQVQGWLETTPTNLDTGGSDTALR